MKLNFSQPCKYSHNSCNPQWSHDPAFGKGWTSAQCLGNGRAILGPGVEDDLAKVTEAFRCDTDRARKLAALLTELQTLTGLRKQTAWAKVLFLTQAALRF